MKRHHVYIITLLTAAMLSLSGCDVTESSGSYYNPKYSRQSQDRVYNEEKLKEILECFDNKDADRLKAMFSKSIQQEYDLDSQIEKAFEIYGEESVSYGSFFDWGASRATEYGEYVRKNVAAEMESIKTTERDIFNIYFSQNIVNDENPNELGVKRVTLCAKNGAKLAIIGDRQKGEKVIERIEN